jgi:hypothetical protein
LTFVHFASDETRFFLTGIFVRVVQKIQAPERFNMVQFQRSFSQLKTEVDESLPFGRHFSVDGEQGEQVLL